LASEGADVVMNGFGDPIAIKAVRSELAERYSIRARCDGADAWVKENFVSIARRSTIDINKAYP